METNRSQHRKNWIRRAWSRWKPKLKLWMRLILNWRFLICFGLAWLITNGWSYVLLGLGMLLKNAWMIGVASGYLTFLWLPVSPEKLVTVAISLFLVQHLFPKHNQALREQILAAAGEQKPKKKKQRSDDPSGGQ